MQTLNKTFFLKNGRFCLKIMFCIFRYVFVFCNIIFRYSILKIVSWIQNVSFLFPVFWYNTIYWKNISNNSRREQICFQSLNTQIPIYGSLHIANIWFYVLYAFLHTFLLAFQFFFCISNFISDFWNTNGWLNKN